LLLDFPTAEEASVAAPLAVATTAPTATFAVVLTVRATFAAIDVLSRSAVEPLGDLVFAAFADVLAVVGVTLFGAALPNAGFASFERAAIAGAAPAFTCVVLADLEAGFFALVAIEFLVSV
jgi:hypothetical protein